MDEPQEQLELELKEQLRRLVTGHEDAPALRELLSLGAAPALALLPAARGEEDRDVRLGVALMLAHLLDPGTVPALCELLRDDAPNVRQMAACALGQIGGEAALQALLQVLEAEQDTNVISQAVLRLAQIGDGRAIEPLQKLQRDWEANGRGPSFMKRYIQDHIDQVRQRAGTDGTGKPAST